MIDYSKPKRGFKPPSTPEKPMKAKLSRPATTRTMAVPRMPLGTLINSNCSRSPAKTMRESPKPMAEEKAYTTLSNKL